MKQMFEILIPLVLIIVLLMCMMNNNTEEAFSVGGATCGNKKQDKDTFNFGARPKIEKFTPGDCNKSSNSNTAKKQCKVTMVWANWCGFSKKAKPEWDNLVKNWNNKEIDGCKVTF